MDIHLRNAINYLLWDNFGLDLRDDCDTVLNAAIDRAYNKRVPKDAVERMRQALEEMAANPQNREPIRASLIEDLVTNECQHIKQFSAKSATGWFERAVRNVSALHSVYSLYSEKGAVCPAVGEFAASECPMSDRAAVDFLLQEFDFDSNAGQILRAAVNRAYRDAATRGSYVPDPTQKVEADAARERASTVIESAILELCSTHPDYDDWHASLCRAVREKYQGIRRKGGGVAFTYGNAQKWVNVAMKNLYVLSAVFGAYAPNSSFYELIGKQIATITDRLHVPVDSYILTGAAKLNIQLPRKDAGKAESKTNRLPWSSWESELDYQRFQRDLAKAIGKESRIEWETRAWVDLNREASEREEALARKRAQKATSEKRSDSKS